MTDEIKDDVKPVETAHATQTDAPVKTPLFIWVIGVISAMRLSSFSLCMVSFICPDMLSLSTIKKD